MYVNFDSHCNVIQPSLNGHVFYNEMICTYQIFITAYNYLTR